MRTPTAHFVVWTALALVLAGCLSPSQDEEVQTFEPTGGPLVPGPAQEGEATDRDKPVTSEEADNSHDTQGTDTQDESEGAVGEGCAAHDPPVPAHPTEQQVESEDELQCPGQFVILDEGDGPEWELPNWDVGDWWLYEHRDHRGHCERMKETVVDDSKEILDVPVYTLEIQRYRMCTLSEDGDPTTQNRSQDSLMHITQEGFIRHDLVFPLREGMTWLMAGNCEDGCVVMQMREVTFIPEFDHDGQTLEVWHTEWSFDRPNGEVVFKKWWGVEHKALLKEQMWFSHLDEPLVEKTLVDSG